MFSSLPFAARSLLRSPGFTLLAVVTLGLGIGANTAMFSIVNSIILKPLPYPESEQLQRLDRVTPQNPQGRVSPADYLDLRREMEAYGEIGAYALGDTSLSEPGQPAEIVRALRISANFLSVLRVRPYLGRDFLPREELPGSDHVVILSHRCWQQRFGSAHDIIGRVIRVDGQPHEVLGVLPPWFNEWRHLGAFDFFRPLALDQEKASDRRSTTLRLIGRRLDRLSAADASAFIANFGTRLAKDFPEVNAGAIWRPVALNGTALPRNAIAMLSLLIGLSAIVLLIACSNLANLLLARTMSRAREFAVRGALGASRLQLLRPLISESVLLALAGGACSMIVARWCADWLSVRTTGENGERLVFAFDWHVFVWAFAAATITALAFGLAPALFALRLNVNDTLKSGSRGMTGGRGHARFRNALIVAQFALAMVLLTGAALYIRAFDELNNTRGGWSSDHLVTGTVVLPSASYGDPEKINTFHRLTIERLRGIPGVATATISAFTPFFNWGDVRKYIVEGRELPQPGREPAAVVNSISATYFDTYQTRLQAGRPFDDRDTLTSPKVFIIGQAMAVSLFGNENPIRRRIAQTGLGPSQWGEIIGVAADIVSVLPDTGPVTLQLYQAMTQEPRPYNEIAVRCANGSPASLIAPIRNVMSGLDPDLPVRQLQPADVTIERANAQTAILRDMLSAFAVVGLGLASLGIYGVIARTMAQRTGEFAIRFAMGASIRDITRIVLTAGLRLAAWGVAVGLIGAFGLARLLSVTNSGMHFDNPAAFIAPVLLLVVIALVASWLPARRAARINPIEALRAE